MSRLKINVSQQPTQIAVKVGVIALFRKFTQTLQQSATTLVVHHNYSDHAGIPALLQKHPPGLHGLTGRALQAVVAACSAL